MALSLTRCSLVNIHPNESKRIKKGTGQKRAMNILFVCLGNICRSAAAEGVFKKLVKDDCKQNYEIDSCGTGGGSENWYLEDGHAFHIGDAADKRMRKEGKKRGIEMTSRARSLTKEDLNHFDIIVAMDDNNVEEILKAANYWGASYGALAKQKTVLMCDYTTKYKGKTRVPDPYIEGGFDGVLDLLEDACLGLYESTKNSAS